jgi:hypothetical protein
MTGQPDRPLPTIVDVLRDGILDSESAGLLWLLADGGVPIVVAGDDARSGVVGAILDLVPATRRQLVLAGPTEDFKWLAGAEGLGWVRTDPADPEPADPGTTTLLAGELGLDPPADLTGDRARLAIRALGRGFGLIATIDAAGLDEVFATLRRRPIFLTDDELTNLGVVLVVGRGADDDAGSNDGPRMRVLAAHYVRPLARDVHGHTQRLPPAVLATWDGRMGRFEHFAWGIAAELAERVGRKVGDFEAESERRSVVLASLAVATDEPQDRDSLRARLDRQRAAGAADPTVHRH